MMFQKLCKALFAFNAKRTDNLCHSLLLSEVSKEKKITNIKKLIDFSLKVS